LKEKIRNESEIDKSFALQIQNDLEDNFKKKVNIFKINLKIMNIFLIVIKAK